MANKKRSSKSAHLPPHLWSVNIRGKQRLQFEKIDGTRSLVDEKYLLQDAIQAAIQYNIKHRSLTLEFDHREPKIKDRFNKPLKVWLPKVLERIKDEEGLAKGTFDRLRNQVKTLTEALGERYSKTITLEDINAFLEDYYGHNKKRTFNDKISNLNKIFSYLADESAVDRNVMIEKKRKKVTEKDYEKDRFDLNIREYNEIYEAAPLFLKVAMSLTLQTTHVVNELYRIKYSIDAPEPGVCGIVWNDQTNSQKYEDESRNTIYGTLYIHREKVKKTKAAGVAIPITKAIMAIIELSKSDQIDCPYIIHRKPVKRTRGLAKKCDHPYQVEQTYISKKFTEVCGKIGIFDHLEKNQYPSFHEIRGLSARLIEESGDSATQIMAHNSEKTTKIYTRKKSIIWNHVTPLNINSN